MGRIIEPYDQRRLNKDKRKCVDNAYRIGKKTVINAGYCIFCEVIIKCVHALRDCTSFACAEKGNKCDVDEELTRC